MRRSSTSPRLLPRPEVTPPGTLTDEDAFCATCGGVTVLIGD